MDAPSAPEVPAEPQADLPPIEGVRAEAGSEPAPAEVGDAFASSWLNPPTTEALAEETPGAAEAGVAEQAPPPPADPAVDDARAEALIAGVGDVLETVGAGTEQPVVDQAATDAVQAMVATPEAGVDAGAAASADAPHEAPAAEAAPEVAAEAPAPEPFQMAPIEAAPLPDPPSLGSNGGNGGGTAGGDAVRAFVLQAMFEGSPRDQIEVHLRDTLGVADPTGVIDGILAEQGQ
jgi:hypothetical protein